MKFTKLAVLALQ